MNLHSLFKFFFFFNVTATTEIYTLSYTTLFRSKLLVRALQLVLLTLELGGERLRLLEEVFGAAVGIDRDRKSTRLNSSHVEISYAVFCLKKKKKHNVHSSMFYVSNY